MTYRAFIKRLLFITMTFMILLCTSGCGEDEKGVYISETKALLKLANEVKKLGETPISSDKEERELLIKLHKAYYEGKSGYDKAWDKGNELADIRFKKEDELSYKLNIPYLIWLIFASYLSLGVYILN